MFTAARSIQNIDYSQQTAFCKFEERFSEMAREETVKLISQELDDTISFMDALAMDKDTAMKLWKEDKKNQPKVSL